MSRPLPSVSGWAERHVEPEIIEGELIEDSPPKPRENYEFALWAQAGAVVQILLGAVLCMIATGAILTQGALLAIPGFWLIFRGIRQARGSRTRV